jgi:hypothetical protein
LVFGNGILKAQCLLLFTENLFGAYPNVKTSFCQSIIQIQKKCNLRRKVSKTIKEDQDGKSSTKKWKWRISP